MAAQFSLAERNAELNTLNTNIGTNAQIIAYTGAPPASVAEAPTGTLLVQYVGNATSFGSVASGVLTAGAVANAVASGSGNSSPGYFRINTSGGVAVAQGTVFQQVVIATNALSAANSNVLNFASTTGVLVGMNVTGAGVPPFTTVAAVTTTTVTMSTTTTAGVANAASITFNGDLTVTGATISSGQTCTFGSLTLTRGGV